MTKVTFRDASTIEVVANDGEKFTLRSLLPVSLSQQKSIGQSLAKYFEENFSDDKTSMIYWVLMKMMANESFSFSYENSDRTEERQRIGKKIRQLREIKGIEAKQLAILTGIDAANISRIEQGRYSVGLDVLSKISQALGMKVDLVEQW